MKKLLSILVLSLLFSFNTYADQNMFTVQDFDKKYYHLQPKDNRFTNYKYKIYKNEKENKKFYKYLLKYFNDNKLSYYSNKRAKITIKKFYKEAKKYNATLTKPEAVKFTKGFNDEKYLNFPTINIHLNFFILDFSDLAKKIGTKKTIKFLNEKGYKTLTTKKHIEHDLKIANNIWNKKGVTFFTDIKSIRLIDPKVSELRQNMKWMEKNCTSHTSCLVKPKKKSEFLKSNFLKQHKIYRQITNSEKNYYKHSINIYYLPRMLSSKNCGIASSLVTKASSLVTKGRKNKFYVVLGHECHNHIRGKTLAHELGHIIGLKHINDKNNLMYPFITGGNQLTDNQSVYSRRHYKENVHNN